MRLLFAPFALAALLLVPSALADQDLDVGPVNVKTENVGNDDCEAEGSSYRAVTVGAEPTPDQQAAGQVATQCTHFSGSGYDFRTHQLSVFLIHCGYNTCSGASYTWYRFQSDNGQQVYVQCGGYANVFGPNYTLPCPSPLGTPPPMLPELP